MQTNFFSNIHSLQLEGDIVITIKCSKHQHLLMTVLLNNDNIADAARKIIPPLNLKGTIQEMDEDFFQKIKVPLQKTSELFTNMLAYEKAQEDAKVQSKMNQDKLNKDKKEKDNSNKKYENAMKKVNDLEANQKYREAYGQLPKVDDFPEMEDEITAKKEELSAHFEQPGLF